MTRKSITLLLVALAFGLVRLAEAQQQAKMAKIGLLRGAPAASEEATKMTEAFSRELRVLGYVDGRNIVFEHRSADNRTDRFPALADELVRLKVDIIIAASTAAALAAKNATRTIPIVMIGVTDPIGAGLVDGLARPGGNITGFTDISSLLAGKRLELLKETVPKASRIALLWNPVDPASVQEWNESLQRARELGLQVYSMEVSSAEKYERAFKEAIGTRSDALAAPQDSLAASNQKQIVELAAKYKLPAIYPRGDFVESGGLMSYGPDQAEPYKRVASMVDKILKGTKPADIPVEQPRKFELVINLKAAKQIGLTIPPNVLARADKVIK